MSWNYRVIVHSDETEPNKVVFAIHEVHYDEQGNPRSMTENPIIVSSSVTGLSDVMEMMRRAFGLPLLLADSVGSPNAR